MRLRLLPVLIVVVGVALTARVGALWDGFASLAQAQTGEPAAPAAGGAAPPRGAGARGAPASAPGPDREQGAGEEASAAAGGLPSDPLSMTDEEIELLQALADRRRELDLRARQLAEREALLQAAERRIEEKAGGLQELRKRIEAMLARHEQDTETQYRSLVKIYENMRPKDAAQIFEELDMAVVLPVVERMKERKTAPILAKMNPVRAKAITEELAQRRELPDAPDEAKE